MVKPFRLIFLLILLAVALFSCKKESNNIVPLRSIVINLEHYVGDEEVEFNDIKYMNAFGNEYSVETLKYFISDITFQREGGSRLYIHGTQYVDGLDEGTKSFEADFKAPEGNFESISFVFGLNEDQNLPGRFPNPPENNMEWPPALGTGYHYMKLEGKVDSAGVVNNYQAHTGPSLGNQYYIEVTLPDSDFTIGGSDITLTIRMDINKWWETPNVFDLNQMTMVMGNTEVQQKLKENGGDVFSLVSVESK